MRVTDDPGLARAFTSQADACETMSAPFTARVCRGLAGLLDDSSALGRRLLDWPRENRGGDLLPIRCCGGLHALARAGTVTALTSAYPPHEIDEDGLRAAIAEAIIREDEYLAAFLDSAPQTNEIGRSAILLGGLLSIGRDDARPITLFEIGASAGLNQLFDRWRYDLGNDRTWGDAQSPVVIRCAWTGPGPPLDAPLEIVSRRACDLNPLDPRDATDRERLLSFVWADQAERLARAAQALGIAAKVGTRPDEADAAHWFARELAPAVARPETTSVLFHSVFIQYLPPDARAALVAAIHARGAAATQTSPFAWLRMEASEANKAQCELRLTRWPGGADEHLADVDWHGRSAAWTRSPI